MTMSIEEYKALEARYQECEANLTKSAMLGKELVEKLSELQGERDALLQERHSLKQTLETKIALEVSLMEEVEAMKKGFTNDMKALKDDQTNKLQDFEMKAKLWKETENRLELTIEGLESQLSAAMIKIKELEKCQTEVLPPKEVSFSTSDETDQLQADLFDAKATIKQLKETISGLEQDNEELKEQVETLRVNINELKESIEEKDSELAEMFPALKGNMEMNWEDETAENIDTAITKGNSLFSEVDDRRLLVENQLQKYKEMCESFKSALDVKNRQMSRLRAQNVTLMNITAGGSESSNNIRRLEELLEMERNKSSTLMSRIAELEKNPTSSAPVLATKRRETVFLPAPVLKPLSADQEQDAQAQLRNQIRQGLVTEEKLRETIRSMSVLENNCNKLKCENFQLKMRLQSLTDKKDLSGVVSKPKTETLKEMIIFDEEKNRVPEESAPLDDNIFDNFLKPCPSVAVMEKPDRKSKVFKGPKKVVSFSEVSVENEGEGIEVKKENLSPPEAKQPRKRVAQNKLIDCDEEDKKMKEACVQQ